jgi:hypothetical protein
MFKIVKKIFSSLFKSECFWLLLIILGAFLVRLYKLNNPVADWHSWRQADTASVSKVFLDGGIKLLLPRYHDISSIQTGFFNPQGYRMVEFPVFNALHVILARSLTFLSFDAAGRMVSILSSLVSTIILFFLGRHFLGKWGGVLSSFFFAFIPYNIYFSRVILPEPLTVTFALASILTFVIFIDKEKWLYLYVSGAFFALAMLMKPYIGFYALPLIYLAIKKYSLKGIFTNGKLLIIFLIFVDIALLPFFLWRIWMNKFPTGIPFFEWAFNGDKIRFRPAFWRWIFIERLGKLILAVWGLPMFVYGVVSSKFKNNFVQFFLLGMFLYVSVVATASVRHDYYQIFTIPAISLAIAAGTLHLISSMETKRWLAGGVVIFATTMMLGGGVYQIKDFYQVNHPEIIEAGKAVERLTPKDALVIAPYNGDTAFLYQTGRWGWPAVDTSFEKLINERGADYYVSVNLEDTDTKYIISNYKVIEQTSQYLIADLHQPLMGGTK